MKVRLCSTIIRPRYVKVASESTSDTHTVIPSTIWNDPICTCPGFRFRETCKHVTNVEAARCEWIDRTQPPNSTEIVCPNCGADTMIFDLEPELDDPPRLWTPDQIENYTT